MKEAATALLALTLVLGGAVGEASADDRAAAEFYEDAVIRFEEGDHAAAIVQLKNALQALPEHRPSQILMARTYLAMGEPAAAEKHLLNARELGADEALIVLPLAEAFLAQSKFEEVILNLRYSGYAPDIEYRLRSYQGRAHTELGELDKAIRAYRDAQRLDPSAPEPLAGEAMVLLLQGDVDLARAKARLATERAPDSPNGWSALASVTHAMGKVDEALEQYGRVLELDPDNLDARLARASVYIDREDLEPARVDLEFLRGEYPFEPRVAYLQSVLLRKLGDDEKARQLLSETAQILGTLPEKILRQETSLQLLGGLTNFSLKAFEQSEAYLKRYLSNKPNDLGARRLLASIFLKRRAYSDAADVLDDLLEATPNDPRILSMAASSLVARGRHAEAVPLLERAVVTSGDDVQLRAELAFARLAIGDRAGATQLLESVLAEDAGQQRAGIGLVSLYLRAGRVDDAVEVARAVVKRSPASLIARNLLGTTLFRAGEADEATGILTAVVTESPSFLPARINLAKIAKAQGDINKARQQLKQILAEQPEHVGTLFEMARLDEVQGNFREAAGWVEKVLAIQPKSEAAVGYLADLHLAAGEPGKALAVARAAETWAPDSQRVLMALARGYLAQDRRDVAAAVLQRLSTQANYDATRLMQIAALQRRSGALEDAAWSLQKAVDGDPDLLVARIQLVSVLVELEKAEQALEVAEALREKAPDAAPAIGAVGEALAAAGRMEDAAQAFSEALAVSGTDFAAVKYFQALTTLDTERADAWLSDWVAGHPEHRMAMQALAERSQIRGDTSNAVALYEQLLAKRQNDVGLLNNYAVVLDATGDDRALGVAEKANRLAPNDPYVSDTLGWMLVRRGDVARGLALLRNAFSKAGRSPAIRYHIAYALKELGRTGEARREVEAALAMRGPFRQRADAEALLDSLGSAGG